MALCFNDFVTEPHISKLSCYFYRVWVILFHWVLCCLWRRGLNVWFFIGTFYKRRESYNSSLCRCCVFGIFFITFLPTTWWKTSIYRFFCATFRASLQTAPLDTFPLKWSLNFELYLSYFWVIFALILYVINKFMSISRTIYRIGQCYI